MVTEATQAKIVPAREDHVPFIAWVELAAARSHRPKGPWDLYINGTEEATLRYLETICATGAWHFASYRNFIVAEVDGTPAAALSGYFEEECGTQALNAGIDEANAKLGRTAEENAAGWTRAGSFAHVTPERVPGAWIVEWVATAPEFRRRGLVDRLLQEMLDIGRAKGATTAEIGVLIGNDAAQRAYEKNGFAVVSEKRHPEFEAAYGTPGTRELHREI